MPEINVNKNVKNAFLDRIKFWKKNIIFTIPITLHILLL